MGVRTIAQEWWRDVTLNGVLASNLIPGRSRWLFLRAFGMHIERSHISAGCFIGSVKRLVVGRGVFVNYGCFFDTTAGIELGSRCNLGMQVLIITGSHRIAGPSRRAGDPEGQPVAVGAGSWLGARVTVLPGVTIGEGCVVAAGALVADDCAAHGLYAGVPARRVRDLDPTSKPAADV